MFDKIIANLDADKREFIEQRIEEARGVIQAADYEREYDDITPHLFEEIGEALFLAVHSYPVEPEIELPQQPILKPGESAFYCRKCEAPRAFVLSPAYGWQCKVCGRPRVAKWTMPQLQT